MSTVSPEIASAAVDAPVAAEPGRWLPRLAAILAVVAILEAIAIVALSGIGDSRFRMALDLPTVGFLASVILLPLVGALIIGRRPRTAVAWVMVAMGLALGTGLVAFGYGATGLPPQPQRPLALEALVVSQLFFVPALGLGTTMLLLIYPTGDFIGPRWRPVAIGAVVGTLLYEAGTLFRVGELDAETFPGVLNPLSPPADLAPLTDGLVIVGNAIGVSLLILAALSLVLRYRRADPVVAAQIRWFALVAGLAAIALAIAVLQSGPISDFAYGVGIVMLGVMPISIGFAITRYRLYDIDRLINRTLVYGSLTAILAGVFTAGVGLGQRLFVAYTGQSSDAALVLATLVIATLYAPLRKRLEAIIDRHFKYETRRFGSYTDRVKSVLAVIDPVRAAENLAREAVLELDAPGAAVVDGSGAVLASAGTWPLAGDAAITRVPLGDSGPLRAILLAPRRGDRPYPAAELTLLEEAGRLTASAIRPG